MTLPRWIPTICSAALLALLAWMGAHWFWTFAAPDSDAGSAGRETGSVRPLEAIQRSGLFGVSAASPASGSTASSADLVLRGISATRKGGMAVIAIDKGRTVAVSAGDEIVPGVRLERVLPDHVVVSRGGVAQRLDLPRRQATDAPPVSPAGTPAKR